MFGSIKSWINIPATLRSYIGQTGSGSKQFAPNRSFLCYAEGKVQLVRTETGEEVISNQMLYVFGDEDIKVQDRIIFNGAEWPVIAVNIFFRKGIPDIRVVFL